ncbi:uncharacterized protein LOC7474405 isoform X2 [Populus trichocarpa]|uniref:uncharacterized protein LOC7474405 isoform X2 n=1 Tax=Populus trichocarpa TaxID=3694 RepID=UPI000D18B237|nr:uncharacterized protein LOC7474405 isoform X2 [Populus trichocarpa]|eukprot:XP_024466854.1 uncharacterized protein LOC7474405 isoform X2 [Populus trichocarpa]
MGKSLPSTGKLLELSKIVSSHKPRHKRSIVPVVPSRPSEVRVDSERLKVKKMEESSLILDGQKRVPLGQVVSDCAKRWFEDTLKEAKTGDISMQVLVGQMYFNGYGVPKDVEKCLIRLHCLFGSPDADEIFCVI